MDESFLEPWRLQRQGRRRSVGRQDGAPLTSPTYGSPHKLNELPAAFHLWWEVGHILLGRMIHWSNTSYGVVTGWRWEGGNILYRIFLEKGIHAGICITDVPQKRLDECLLPEPTVGKDKWLASGHVYIGWSVTRNILDNDQKPTGTYSEGVVTHWLPASTSGFTNSSVPAALWRIEYKSGALRGDKQDLELFELQTSKLTPAIQSPSPVFQPRKRHRSIEGTSEEPKRRLCRCLQSFGAEEVAERWLQNNPTKTPRIAIVLDIMRRIKESEWQNSQRASNVGESRTLALGMLRGCMSKAHEKFRNVCKLLCKWAVAMLPHGFKFTTLQVAKNLKTTRHVDKNNISERPSAIISLGKHVGGNLWTAADGELKCRGTWRIFEGHKEHYTMPFWTPPLFEVDPERFSLVVYSRVKDIDSSLQAQMRGYGFPI